ncbi:MAG: APC family permease [Clostridiales bacterium]|nr:APC family permease [Clostridiales bacterium]
MDLKASALMGTVILFVGLMLLLALRRGVTYRKEGHVYVGFVGVSAIAMMDLLASVFYGPGEAYRYIGYDAMFYLVLTALLIALYAFSMTEIAEILEGLKHKGGGVYTITYLVFGPLLSMVAVASILVDYINMAALSSISAVENFATVIPIPHLAKLPLELFIIWFLAFLNIIGIRANVWTTFGVFLFLGTVLTAGVALGAVSLTPSHIALLREGFVVPFQHLIGGGLIHGISVGVAGIGFVILSYSGIETVLQTQKLVESWKEIRKAYTFLVILNGLLIPLVGILALAEVKDPSAHVEGLVAAFALEVGGDVFGLFMVLAAALALAFAMNTAFVGGTELLSVMAERYGLEILLRTNRYGIHYVIVLFLSLTFTALLLVTRGSANVVADMFAVGLLASFIFNLLGLITFRFTQGSEVMRAYRTGMAKNLFLLLAFTGAFIFVAAHKIHGFLLWSATAALLVLLGILAARFFRNPELAFEDAFQTTQDLLDYIREHEGQMVDLYFVRPQEPVGSQGVYITLALQRLQPPRRKAPHHFVLPFSQMWGVVKAMEAVLAFLAQELPDRRFRVHLRWSLSSWRERLSTGFFIHDVMKLPLHFPQMTFNIEYEPKEVEPWRPT